jgi:hypothetical protein
MRIYELIWNQDRIDHIAQHSVSPESLRRNLFWDSASTAHKIGRKQPCLQGIRLSGPPLGRPRANVSKAKKKQAFIR